MCLYVYNFCKIEKSYRKIYITDQGAAAPCSKTRFVSGVPDDKEFGLCWWELGIQENMLYLWKRKYLEEQKEAFPGKGKLKSKDEYIISRPEQKQR